MASRSGTLILLIGALIGVLLAASGLITPDPPQPPSSGALPEDAVARVNGRIIGRAEYERALRALRADPRGIERPEERALQRLIDEALLVQRGLELDIALRDVRVRTDIASAVIQHIVVSAESSAGEPDEATLQRFYRDNPHIFRVPAQLWVRARTYTSEASAEHAYEQLRTGTPFDALPPHDPDASPLPLPQGLVPAAKLRDYLGPTATLAVLNLLPGQTTDVLRSGEQFLLIQVVQRKDGALRPYEDVHEWVHQSYLRHIGDEALRAFLEERRDRAHIEIAEDLP